MSQELTTSEEMRASFEQELLDLQIEISVLERITERKKRRMTQLKKILSQGSD